MGEGVTRFQPGDRAAYGTGGIGAYAEAHRVDANRGVKVPDDMPLTLAAAVMLQGMNAEFLAKRVFHVKQGDTALVHATAGGVGLILCQWLKAIAAAREAHEALARRRTMGSTALIP